MKKTSIEFKERIHRQLQVARNSLFFPKKQNSIELCRLCAGVTTPFQIAHDKLWYRCPACNFLQAGVSRLFIRIMNKGEGFKAGTGIGGGGYREYWISELLRKDLKLTRILLYGTGNTPTFALLNDRGVDVWGCDISTKLVAERRKRYGDRFFNVKNFPMVNFRAIVAVEVFEHLLNPFTVIDSMARHLTEDGIIAGTTDLYNGSDLSGHMYISPLLHISYWSEQSFRKIAAMIGRSVTFFELESPGSVYPEDKFGLLWPNKRVFFIYPAKYDLYFKHLRNYYPILPINKP